MTVRWGAPAERPALLEAHSWQSTLALLLTLLVLAGGFLTAVAG